MKTVTELLKAKPSRVVSIRPEQTVLEAIKVLASEDIGAAVVMSGSQLVGILSERDYTRKIILKHRSSDTTRVEEIMTPNVVCVSPRTKTRDCMALMTERGIRHLDFGEIAEPPAGFDPGTYADDYGGAPAIANYFFYPQPAAAITTTTLT